jgi:chemotaxis protein methyltransferase CheR
MEACKMIELDKYNKLIELYSGLIFPETHSAYIIEAIEKELDNRNITNDEYYNLLKNIKSERENFFNKITINETYFFREEKHFHIMKELLESNKKMAPINFWSVTCSTGEEAISLALLASYYMAKNKIMDYTVYATDINQDSIFLLQSGKYTQNSFRNDGSTFHHLLQPYLTDSRDLFCKIESDLINKIRTHQLNLVEDAIDEIPDESIDFAFFRNTLVYMKEETKKKIINKILPKIKRNGYLFLSATEVPFIKNDDLISIERSGTYFFQKIVKNSPNAK